MVKFLEAVSQYNDEGKRSTPSWQSLHDMKYTDIEEGSTRSDAEIKKRVTWEAKRWQKSW
jgi:hypothetical protein